VAQVDGTPGVQKLSVKHTDVMNFMLANPLVKLADVARHFGMTQPWLSCIIHSEAFQAELATKSGEIFSATVLPIKQKMTAIAHQALDQIGDRMPMMEDKVVAQVADSVLDRLGFGSKVVPLTPAPTGHVTINFNLKNELEEARKLIGARSAVSPGAAVPALEVMVDGEIAPIGIGRPQEVCVARDADSGAASDGLALARAAYPRSEVLEGSQV